MNRTQKTLTILALVAFVWTILSAPWEIVRFSSLVTDSAGEVSAPIFSPPVDSVDSSQIRGRAVLRVSSLAVEWLAIGVIYLALLFVFKSKPVAAPAQASQSSAPESTPITPPTHETQTRQQEQIPLGKRDGEPELHPHEAWVRFVNAYTDAEWQKLALDGDFLDALKAGDLVKAGRMVGEKNLID